MNYFYCFNDNEAWLGYADKSEDKIAEQIRKDVCLIFIDSKIYNFIKDTFENSDFYANTNGFTWVKIWR